MFIFCRVEWAPSGTFVRDGGESGGEGSYQVTLVEVMWFKQGGCAVVYSALLRVRESKEDFQFQSVTVKQVLNMI